MGHIGLMGHGFGTKEMGLAERIAEIKDADEKKNASAEKENANPLAENCVAALFRDARPCPTCGSQIAWWDVYGGGPHCHRCRDWPAVSLVKCVFVTVERSDGSWEWKRVEDIEDATCGGSGDVDGNCTHPRIGRVPMLVAWPAAAPAADGTLLVDWNREVDRFELCKRCGKWI